MSNLNNRDKNILKEIIETGYKALLYKYSEEEMNHIIKEVYKSINQKGE